MRSLYFRTRYQHFKINFCLLFRSTFLLLRRRGHCVSNVKTEAASSCETLVPIYQTTRPQITKDSKLNIHLVENLKSQRGLQLCGCCGVFAVCYEGLQGTRYYLPATTLVDQ
jgi:hypothetical protein